MIGKELKVKERDISSIPIAGCVIMDGEGKVLLLHRNKENKRKDGEMLIQWELPGGGFEESLDNDLRDTAVRENKEELGLDVEIVGDEPLGTDVFDEYGDTLEYTWFQAKVVNGDLALEEGFDEYRYFSWDEIREMENELSLNMKNLLRAHDANKLNFESTQH